MAASPTGDTNNAESIKVCRNCTIKQILIAGMATLNATAEDYEIQVSKVPYFQGSTEASGVLATVMGGHGNASGVRDSLNVVIPMDEKVSDGEQIYINVLSGSAEAMTIKVQLYTT